MTSDPTGSFRTHANYIRAFATLADFDFPRTSLDALSRTDSRIRSSPSFIDQQTTTPNFDQVRSSLANAWGTELLLGLAARYASEDELVRIANNWAVVQTYYVTYHATQALIVARGHPRPESHPKTQNQFVSMWVNRPLQLAPWSLGRASSGLLNIPAGKTIDDTIQPWTGCNSATCWDLAAKALRTTRADGVKQARSNARDSKRKVKRREWKEAETQRLALGRKPRKEPIFTTPTLTPSEGAEVERRVRPYSMIDYLYRLRIKTNYQDSAMFTDGPEDEHTPRQVQRDLCHLAAGTSLLSELHVRQCVGRQVLTDWIDDWLESNMPKDVRIGLALRRDLILRL